MLAGAGVLGPDAISGDPGALEALVGQLRTSAGHVEGIQGRVSANGLGGSWSGTAADAFRVSLDALPGELEKLHSSFSVAADAIGGYAHVLAELQSRAQWLAQEIVDAESGLQSAQAWHSTAQSELHAAQTRHVAASDPASKSLAQAAVDRASGAVAAAQAVQEECAARVSSLRSSARQNREELDRAASTCASGLAAASNLGISNSFGSWMDRILHDLSSVSGWGAVIATLIGDAAFLTVRNVEFAWKTGIPRLIGQVARWVQDGGKGLSLRLISELRSLGAGKVAEDAKLLQALGETKGLSGWGKLLARFPGLARVAGAVDKVATPLGLVLGVVQYAVDSRAGIVGGWNAFTQHPGAALGFLGQDLADGEIERDASFGILHVLSLGLFPDNADAARQQLAYAHLALNPQPPANFTNEQKIAAQAALKYTGTGWNAVPLIGGAFTSSSAAQRALYQGVLSNDMVAMVQSHNVAGINKLATWIQQQPYGNASVAKPYKLIAQTLKSYSSDCIGPQQAQAIVVKALGRSEMQAVLQGAFNP